MVEEWIKQFDLYCIIAKYYKDVNITQSRDE